MNIMNRFTLQTLYKNKLRTLVTIIGIILSTAMFTGVTSIVTSLQQYLINLEINDNGRWHRHLICCIQYCLKKFPIECFYP